MESLIKFFSFFGSAILGVIWILVFVLALFWSIFINLLELAVRILISSANLIWFFACKVLSNAPYVARLVGDIVWNIVAAVIWVCCWLIWNVCSFLL